MKEYKTLIFTRQEILDIVCEKHKIDPKNISFNMLSAIGLRIGLRK